MNWGYLHVVQIATDTVQIAANNTTNAPPGSVPPNCWGSTRGPTRSGTSCPETGWIADTIIPELPASTSSVYKTLVAELKTANGGTAPTLSSSIKTVEQNDPTAITQASTPADAIVPFSAGRLALWNSGYFHNRKAFPGGAVLTPGVKLLSGAAPDAGAA